MKYIAQGLALVVLFSCRQSAGDDQSRSFKRKQRIVSNQDIAAITGAVCSRGGKQYAPLSKSRVKWTVTKINTRNSVETTFTGSNIIKGGLAVADNRLGEAQAVFDFSIDSTSSGDALRDERIHEYIFGKYLDNVLQFRLDGFKAKDLLILEGNTVEGIGYGSFIVGGQRMIVEIELLIKESLGGLIVTPKQRLQLNLRQLTPSINGVNLIDPIAHLLTLVENVEIKDTIDIDFVLEMNNVCSTLL